VQSVAGGCKIARRFGFPYGEIRAGGELMIKNLCVAGIRLLALYLSTYAGLLLLTWLILYIGMPTSSNSSSYAVQELLLHIVTLAVAVGLWVYAPRIAERMAPDTEPEGAVSVDAQDFVLIGLCLLGAAILIDSIPSILNILVVEAGRTAPLSDPHPSNVPITEDWNDPEAPNLLESIVQTAMGFGLLLFGFRLRSVLRKFQTLRTKGHDED
jgi:hypothetical protein